MSTCGFGFLPQGIVDWQNFKVESKFIPRLGIPEVARYKRRAELHTLKASYTGFDKLFQIARSYVTIAAQADFIFEVVAQFLIQEFRSAAAAALFPGLSRT